MSPGPGPPMRIPAIANSSRTSASALPADLAEAELGVGGSSTGRGSAVVIRSCPTDGSGEQGPPHRTLPLRPGRLQVAGRLRPPPRDRLGAVRLAEVPQPADVRADRAPHGAM